MIERSEDISFALLLIFKKNYSKNIFVFMFFFCFLYFIYIYYPGILTQHNLKDSSLCKEM
jgi:hypothetical protein